MLINQFSYGYVTGTRIIHISAQLFSTHCYSRKLRMRKGGGEKRERSNSIISRTLLLLLQHTMVANVNSRKMKGELILDNRNQWLIIIIISVIVISVLFAAPNDASSAITRKSSPTFGIKSIRTRGCWRHS